jgi:hypothetical protein
MVVFWILVLVLGIKSILCVIFRDKKKKECFRVFVMCGIQSSVVWNLAIPFSGLRLLEHQRAFLDYNHDTGGHLHLFI